MRHSILETLTDAQRDQLYDWLLEMPVPQVAEKIALPAPDGFGIKTHETTLRRFKRRRWAEDSADQLEDAAKLAGASAADHDTLDTGIASALKRHFFQRASAPDATDEQLSMVARWFHRNEKHKLDVQRVQIVREKFAHKQEMDEFRKEIATARLDLALLKADSNTGIKNQDKRFASPARNWKDINARVREMFNISEEESARRRALRKAWREKQAALAAQAHLDTPTQPQPDSTIAQSQTLPLTAEPSAMPNEDCSMLNAQSNSPDKSEIPTPSALNPNPVHPVNPVQIPPPVSPEGLAKAVDAYTVKRAEEYWAYRRQYSSPPPPYREHPEYVTQYRHCPCGNASPCPIHEDEEKYGRYPEWFWSRAPHSLDYARCLQDRDLPYREPKEFLT